MPRVSKKTALELIHFVKNMSVRANYFDPKAVSAFEFARQMSSPQLKNSNPNFQFSFELERGEIIPAKVQAEFINGKKWEVQTSDFNAQDLRNEVGILQYPSLLLL